MNFIIGIVAMFIAIIVGLVLLAFILHDIKNAKQYCNATQVEGVVCENYGVEKVSYYGRYQIRKYGRYLVRFNSSQGWQTQEVLLRKRKYQKGDVVQVRYIMTEKGVQLLDNISGTRLLELVICFILAIPLCLFCLYVEKNGMF